MDTIYYTTFSKKCQFYFALNFAQIKKFERPKNRPKSKIIFCVQEEWESRAKSIYCID